jgi:putative DNA primase/helicase
MALFVAAASLGSLVAAGLIPELYVAQQLMDAATQCGLVRDDGARECRSTIISGLKTGRNKPREVDLG